MKEEVKMIPINQIRILNPRVRDKKKFEVIIQSIKNLGLKKPIQVSLRSADEAEGPGYDLVCGQGRIEAFMVLGYKEIPAIVVEVSKEDRLLRSLVENMARRFPAPMDMMREIDRLKKEGYSHRKIGEKLDVSPNVVLGLLSLKRDGEERLIESALSGKISLTVAFEIARASTAEAQRALLKAYETKQLNHASIRVVKRLINQRQFFGKALSKPGPRKTNTTAENVVRVFRRESERQKSLVRKARLCESKLLFLVNAFDKLLDDKMFAALVRSESLTIPKTLWSKLAPKHMEAL
jgi:ParB family chromosome partitioning protein